ncbi:glycosyltransferase family 4 protein, partial [bacterium]|nr:glycosyltransferase family 4 protein [bacterium]
YAELAALSLGELDSLMPANRFHPIRGWEWLKKAQGLTLIIDTLQRFNPNGLPSLILPAPVDERLFYPRPINYELRKRLNIPANHLVLSYTGNVRALKRQEAIELYKAVLLLNQQGCPTTLIRTGTNFVSLGKEESRYKEFEKSLGWVSRHEVADVMAASDILVQPGWPGAFDDQRFPAKLPEYFAMGRPVILPRTNLGLKVEHGKEAWVVDRADAEGIAGAVKEIKADEGLKGKLGDGGVDFYLRQFAVNFSYIELKNYYYRIAIEPPNNSQSYSDENFLITKFLHFNKKAISGKFNHDNWHNENKKIIHILKERLKFIETNKKIDSKEYEMCLILLNEARAEL